MYPGESARCERRRRDIISSLPVCSFNGDAGAGEAIDDCECEVLSLAVIPTQAAEETDIGCDLLFNVQTCSIFERSNMAHGSDVGSAARFLGKMNGIAVFTRVRPIGISKNAGRSGMFGNGVAAFNFEHIPAIAE